MQNFEFVQPIERPLTFVCLYILGLISLKMRLFIIFLFHIRHTTDSIHTKVQIILRHIVSRNWYRANITIIVLRCNFATCYRNVVAYRVTIRSKIPRLGYQRLIFNVIFKVNVIPRTKHKNSNNLLLKTCTRQFHYYGGINSKSTSSERYFLRQNLRGTI